MVRKSVIATAREIIKERKELLIKLAEEHKHREE